MKFLFVNYTSTKLVGIKHIVQNIYILNVCIFLSTHIFSMFHHLHLKKSKKKPIRPGKGYRYNNNTYYKVYLTLLMRGLVRC